MEYQKIRKWTKILIPLIMFYELCNRKSDQITKISCICYKLIFAIIRAFRITIGNAES